MSDLFPKNRRNRGILRSANYLSPDYLPKELPHRENQIEEIASCIRPMLQGGRPENAVIYGPPGTGKTSCIRKVLSKLEEETRVHKAYVNCWNYNSQTSSYAQILRQLGIAAPRKGKPVDRLYERMQEFLNKRGKVAIALDELDQLNGKSKVIYDLTRLKKADSRLSLVTVNYKLSSLEDLSSRARSVFSPRTIGFSPYSKGQIIDILEERVDKAFRPNSVPSEVLEKIADFASTSGDCRLALKCLMKAGRRADYEGVQKVRNSQVQGIINSLRKNLEGDSVSSI